jgi:3-oxoadipate enol-lactonase
MSSAAPQTPDGRSDRPAPGRPLRARVRRLSAAALDVPGDAPRTAPPVEPTPPDESTFRPASLPAGRPVDLPGRGETWVHEAPGPDGAPTLLLLHGWTVTGGLNWFPSFPTLARWFRVVALDHRGHGRGIRADRRFHLEDCADDVAALADVLGIDRFVPVGYSMGGPIAQLVWKRHHDRIDGLVLCATSRNFRGTPMERAMFSAFGGLSIAARVTPIPWRQEINARLALRRYDSSDLGHWARDEVARNDPRALIEAGHALGRYSSHDWIGEVDVPTAVIVTQNDPVVPPARQRRLAESIPGAVTYPVAGDHAVCVMRPDLFVPALAQACRRVTSTTPAGDGPAPPR